MPLPLLALAAAPAIAKGLLGAYQLTQDVKRVDTTTPAEREQLALARQASAATMPGMASFQARLAQVQGATIQNAQLGAGSGSDFLAAGAAAASTRQAGENALGVQQARYRDVASQQISQALSQQAAHQRADTERANQAQAALTGSGLTNLFGGLSDGASVAAYGASRGGEAAHPELATDQLTPRKVKLLPSNEPVDDPYPTRIDYRQPIKPFPFGNLQSMIR